MIIVVQLAKQLARPYFWIFPLSFFFHFKKEKLKQNIILKIK
jgi:hypothetical protein